MKDYHTYGGDIFEIQPSSFEGSYKSAVGPSKARLNPNCTGALAKA